MNGSVLFNVSDMSVTVGGLLGRWPAASRTLEGVPAPDRSKMIDGMLSGQTVR
jgi:hypothetical protein